MDDRKVRAERLIMSAHRHIDEWWAAGDIEQFLRTLALNPSYSVVNLTLITEQCPSACYIGRGAYWTDIAGGSPILKPEWEGKGIDIVIPSVEGSDIHWQAVKVYDIRQTELQDRVFRPRPNPERSRKAVTKLFVKTCQALEVETHTYGDDLLDMLYEWIRATGADDVQARALVSCFACRIGLEPAAFKGCGDVPDKEEFLDGVLERYRELLELYEKTL